MLDCDGAIRQTMNIRFRRFFCYVILVVTSLLCIFWVYLLFVNATRSNGELTKGFSLIPSTHLIENWNNMIKGALPVMQGMKNSLFVATLAALVSSYFSIMTAYGIYAYQFKGRKIIYRLMLAFMMIPKQTTVLGFVSLVRELKLNDTFLPLIIPEIATPVVFYYMIKYMQSMLSMSLVEAARIDGSSEFRTFNRIVLPLMFPAFAVQMIFKFVESWNNFFIPAMILESDTKKTMPILVSLMRTSNFMEADNGRVYMMIAFSIMPTVVIYLLLSKLIVSEVSKGGVK